MATPTFIYKIVPESSAPPTPLPEALPVSDLDRNDGFIHLSTSTQLAATLGRFFGKESGVYILKIKYPDVEKDIRWEDSKKNNSPGTIGEPTVFPHLYNELKLGQDQVNTVLHLDRAADEDWASVIENAKDVEY